MGHFTLIADRIDVAPLLREIDENPDLWNSRPERRSSASPHRETSDIWIRYASPEAMREPGFMQLPHESVWWSAYRDLPSLDAIIEIVRQALGGPLRLGGMLATRIPPGCQVYPHHDRGSWHSEYYTTKVWLPLRANDRCVNVVEDERMVWKAGEAWSHDNLVTHSVRNGGETDRVVLILCFRRLE